jgi:hypothetical protein
MFHTGLEVFAKRVWVRDIGSPFGIEAQPLSSEPRTSGSSDVLSVSNHEIGNGRQKTTRRTKKLIRAKSGKDVPAELGLPRAERHRMEDSNRLLEVF